MRLRGFVSLTEDRFDREIVATIRKAIERNNLSKLEDLPITDLLMAAEKHNDFTSVALAIQDKYGDYHVGLGVSKKSMKDPDFILERGIIIAAYRAAISLNESLEHER